jgi:hypothetical protein
MLVCVFLHKFAHETAGAARTRLSLRPLVFEGDKVFAKLGQTVSRERERTSEIDSGLTASLRGALLSAEARLRAEADAMKQSTLPLRRPMDCFAYARNDG